MWHIIHHEWRYLLRGNYLVALGVAFLAMLLLSVLMGSMENQKQQQQYEAATQHLRAQWEAIEAMNPHGAAHYGTYVFKPSNLLSSLDEGIQSITGNVLRVEGHVQNEMVHSEAQQMLQVSRFGKLKSALLLQYVLPLMLIFLAFHSMSSEKQSGRLKMLVLQGADMRSLTWGKTLAIWLCGIILLSLTLLVYAALNFDSIAADVLLRALLIYAAYALYYFVLVALTVYLSARWQNSTVALTSMLGIWILWTLFLPATVMSALDKWHPLPSRNTFQAAMGEDRAKGVDGHNPADERAKALEAEVLLQYGVDSLEQLPINFDGIVMQADEEYGNMVWDKHFGHLREVMNRQKQSYQLMGIFNPFISLQNASMGFAAGDNHHHQDYLLQVEHYRREFIKTLNDAHAYGGSTTGDWSWTADNAFFRAVHDFKYEAPKLGNVFQLYVVDVLLLMCWAILVGLLLVLGSKKIKVL